MESEGLKQFLAVVGDAVHSVGTICVGLSGVATGEIIKPAELTIGWKSTNPEVAAAKARVFALRGSLVFVEEALVAYLNFIKTCSNQRQELVSALGGEGAANRVMGASRFLSGVKPYWEPLVVMLIRWRNKVVHNSKSSLTAAQKKVLLKHSHEISENHAGIDISLTVTNFEKGQITLKDFTTLIAVTIRFVREVDAQLGPSVTALSDFKVRLAERGLNERFTNVMSANGEQTRKRKLKSFLRAEFPTVGNALEEEIYAHAGEICSR